MLVTAVASRRRNLPPLLRCIQVAGVATSGDVTLAAYCGVSCSVTPH